MSLYVRSGMGTDDGYPLWERSDRRLAPVTASDCIDAGARIYGPVVIAEGVCLAKGAVVVGPAVLDRGAHVGEDSIVVGSVLWSGSNVGAHCEVHASLAECDAVIPDGSVITTRTVSAGRRALIGGHAGGRRIVAKKPAGGLSERARRYRVGIARKASAWASLLPWQLAYVFGAGLVLIAFLWSYGPTAGELWREWHRSDDYSAGLLVPFLAAYILWVRRQELASVPVKPAIIGGIAAFAFAQTVRGVGLYKLYGSLEMLSVVLSAAAIVTLLFGWRLLRKLVAILVFLCLMLPWPHRIQTKIGLPLQGWATDSAVFCLELIGHEVRQDGNVIVMGETQVAVAEACNGLRMVTAFLVIGGLVALLVKRTGWEKLIVLASSLPIALLCNTLRLTITAILYKIIEDENVRKLLHDLGGYAMMPLALALVVGELWLMRRLITPPAAVKPAVIARRRTQHAVDS
jgi:exosortase